jgi:hypothetical protein
VSISVSDPGRSAEVTLASGAVCTGSLPLIRSVALDSRVVLHQAVHQLQRSAGTVDCDVAWSPPGVPRQDAG